MAAKPSVENILKCYTLEDLLGLVKEKAALEAEERLSEAKRHLSEALSVVGGGLKAKAVETREMEERKPMERKPRGPRKKASLGKLIQQVVGPQPMGIEEILQGLTAIGYKSKSKDPRRVLYLELKKQVQSNNIKKIGRGMYASK